jgi:hypothetical protein
MSIITYTGITTASHRGRSVCVAPASVRVVPSHATLVSTPVSTGAIAGFGAAWAPMSGAVETFPQAGTRAATDLKAALGATTFNPGYRTWSPPSG